MSGLFEPADCRLDSGVNAICREEGVDGKLFSTLQPKSTNSPHRFHNIQFTFPLTGYNYEEWGEWSKCNGADCDSLMQSRSRTCNEICCAGPSEETRSCMQTEEDSKYYNFH